MSKANEMNANIKVIVSVAKSQESATMKAARAYAAELATGRKSEDIDKEVRTACGKSLVVNTLLCNCRALAKHINDIPETYGAKAALAAARAFDKDADAARELIASGKLDELSDNKKVAEFTAIKSADAGKGGKKGGKKASDIDVAATLAAALVIIDKYAESAPDDMRALRKAVKALASAAEK